MYLCLDCGEIFEEPFMYKEAYGETIACCPYCKGDFVETFRCDCCGGWIDSFEYYKVNKNRYCDDCCIKLNLE